MGQPVAPPNRFLPTRRALGGGALGFFTGASCSRAHGAVAHYGDDFDQLWKTLAENYCYFVDKKTDWRAVRALYRPQALAAENGAAFAEVIRRVLAELYDAHTHLTDPAPGTPYWPPYDMLVEPEAAGARVVAIYGGSAAQESGIRPGDIIVSINGNTIMQAIAAQRPRCLAAIDHGAERYTANVAAGGLRGQARYIGFLRNGVLITADLSNKIYAELPDLESKWIGKRFGLLTVRSFVREDLVSRFDAALQAFASSDGLIIDVRYNGGGDAAVARPIMGRFIRERRAYALMRRRQGAGLSQPWTEFVEPRGPFTYDKPVIVLCGPWTASMAEGFAMGMRDIGRASLVGAPMMGLGAAVADITLRRTGLRAQYSAEPVYDTQDMPRSALRPDIEVAACEDALRVSIATLKRLLASGTTEHVPSKEELGGPSRSPQTPRHSCGSRLNK